ncbi:hypothetical protein AURANDRAFT_69433, partial [Aureococcus anophagefferens]
LKRGRAGVEVAITKQYLEPRHTISGTCYRPNQSTMARNRQEARPRSRSSFTDVHTGNTTVSILLRVVAHPVRTKRAFPPLPKSDGIVAVIRQHFHEASLESRCGPGEHEKHTRVIRCETLRQRWERGDARQIQEAKQNPNDAGAAPEHLEVAEGRTNRGSISYHHLIDSITIYIVRNGMLEPIPADMHDGINTQKDKHSPQHLPCKLS